MIYYSRKKSGVAREKKEKLLKREKEGVSLIIQAVQTYLHAHFEVFALMSS